MPLKTTTTEDEILFAPGTQTVDILITRRNPFIMTAMHKPSPDQMALAY